MSSTVPDNIRENRLRYVEALESGKYKQVFGMYFISYDPKLCCATGVAIDVLGHRDKLGTDKSLIRAEEAMKDDLGMDEDLNGQIIRWNDGADLWSDDGVDDSLSFKEIAAKLRLLWDL